MGEDRRRLRKQEREAESKRIYELRQQGVTLDGLAERFGYKKEQIVVAINSYKKRMRRKE